MTKQMTGIDLMFQALGDPSRRAMIERLALGPASVSELARPLGITLPSVVQHLALLERSGFVASRKRGRVRTCRLQPARLDAARDWLERQRDLWNARFDRMDAYLLENDHD